MGTNSKLALRMRVGRAALALVCSGCSAVAFAGTSPAAVSVAASAARAQPSAQANRPPPNRQQKMTHKAQAYNLAAWGVDNLRVSYTASGNLIRFSYRVADPAPAQALGDKRATPVLIGQRSRAVLQVPMMEKVGMLRQTGTAKAGQEYWMVFSNKGDLVRPGDRVSVVIGAFRADGLMVE